MTNQVKFNNTNIVACRICGSSLPATPELTYKSMPGAAQHLPTADNLDKGVDLYVTECTSCGLVQTLNNPVPYFREVIRAAGISEEMKEFRRVQFRDFINKYDLRVKKVIEIGLKILNFLFL